VRPKLVARRVTPIAPPAQASAAARPTVEPAAAQASASAAPTGAVRYVPDPPADARNGKHGKKHRNG